MISVQHGHTANGYRRGVCFYLCYLQAHMSREINYTNAGHMPHMAFKRRAGCAPQRRFPLRHPQRQRLRGVRLRGTRVVAEFIPAHAGTPPPTCNHRGMTHTGNYGTFGVHPKRPYKYKCNRAYVKRREGLILLEVRGKGRKCQNRENGHHPKRPVRVYPILTSMVRASHCQNRVIFDIS